jgi:MFS family permease
MRRFLKFFIATLFISVNYGALLYVNSTYLETYFSPTAVSLLFLAGAVVNIALFFAAPKILNLFGKKWFFFFALLCLAASVLGMGFSSTALAVGLSFVIYAGLLYPLYYCLDIFIEEESDNGHTGEIRGTYFTIMNAGIAVGPLLLTVLDGGEDFIRIYWAAFLLLIVPFLVSVWILITRHPHKKVVRPWHLLPFKTWWHRRNVRGVTLAKLVLETFYAIMVIYTPIYANSVIGFTWEELAIIFSIALIPFVIIEWPAGRLADKYWGEKEMMTAGFFIAGTMVLLIPFLPKSLAWWALTLFFSRVGAALIEIMCETYFFKQISAKDTGLLSIYRLARPSGNIIGAALGATLLAAGSFSTLFFALAVIVYFGMKESLFLKDTL